MNVATVQRALRRHAGPSTQKYRRLLATESTAVSVDQNQEGCLFVDSVFPITLGKFDVRRYIGYLREDTLLTSVQRRLSAIKTHGFSVTSVEPHHKDGGVFVRFNYTASDDEETLAVIEADVKQSIAERGGIQTWTGLRGGNAWLVKGKPWKEDMSVFPSPIVKVAFEGADVNQEKLYSLIRPYGRIDTMSEPTPVPSGSLRFSTITFRRIRPASVVHNVLHGLEVASGSDGGSVTRLRTAYQSQIQGHAIRDSISKHPKIFFPVLVFLLGTLTYTIFDPIRSAMIQGHMQGWFDVKGSGAYQWLRGKALDIFSNSNMGFMVEPEDAWKERDDAVASIDAYLSDTPATVAFVHGPQGSGKSTLINAVLQKNGRKHLDIDCHELLKTNSDPKLLATLARQTGYWPVFTFLNSVNNMIDLASVGLIGQKAGLSSSISEQLQDILTVVATALKNVSESHQHHLAKEMKRREQEQARDEYMTESLKRGFWHDGRLDCVAGNGIMSELGLGDERVTFDDGSVDIVVDMGKSEEHQESSKEKRGAAQDVHITDSLPIVVIRNFSALQGATRDDILDTMAQWAANLADNQIAHVIVLSDNRENSKRLARALPTKPLATVALQDADAATSLRYIRSKLAAADVKVDLDGDATSYIERLGGRASDLESLIHKIRGGQGVEESVKDIINRGVAELRKNAFGDDLDDAKNLRWTREQAWAILKLLSKQREVPYHDVLLEYPFKGDDAPLRSMEQAELVSIGTHNGRPSVIRPGRPVFKYVFEKLVNDPIFYATQDIAFNEKVIASAEATVKACEDELLRLREIGMPSSWFSSSAPSARADYLLHKMGASEAKIERLEKKNTELKKVLAKGG